MGWDGGMGSTGRNSGTEDWDGGLLWLIASGIVTVMSKGT